MEMPKPSSGHQELERMAGRWEGEEKMHPSQWEPKGGTAIGRIQCRMALSGFALLNDYEQVRAGATTFTGHGVFTFDPESGMYSVHWFDCMGTAPEVFQGMFRGDVLKMEHGGPGLHARITYDLGEPGFLLSHMEMSHDGIEWNTLFEGRYRRLD